MKKILISLAIFLTITLTVTLFLFSETNSSKVLAKVQQEKPEEDINSCCTDDHKSISNSEYSNNSIFQVNSNWKNQFGNEINIGNLRGRIQVFSMIFANCTYACPIIANDMKRIEQSLSEDEMMNVQFTLLSIDHEQDTPERLMKFAKDQNLNLSHFQLLTGNKTDIDDLAALTGFRYKKENDGSFAHSNIITILNEDGEIVHQQIGLNQDIEKTVEVIKNLKNKGV